MRFLILESLLVQRFRLDDMYLPRRVFWKRLPSWRAALRANMCNEVTGDVDDPRWAAAAFQQSLIMRPWMRFRVFNDSLRVGKSEAVD